MHKPTSGWRHQLLIQAAVFFFIISTASATTWYVSSSIGNDANVGTDPNKPWRSLGKIATSTAPKNGDTFLLRRGDVWRESLTLPYVLYQNIVLNSYGDAAKPKPIISGAEAIAANKWVPTTAAPRAYQTTLAGVAPSGPATSVLVYGTTFLEQARSPYFRQANYPSATGNTFNKFQSNDLKAAIAAKTISIADIVGSYMTIRPRDWVYDTRKVTACGADGTVSFDGAPILFGNGAERGTGWGFFFFGKLVWLKQAGQYFVASNGKTLYVRLPGDVDPRTSTTRLVQIGVRDLGVKVNGKQIGSAIRNIRFELQTATGYRALPVSGNTGGNSVYDCEFWGQGAMAVDLSGYTTNVVVAGNVISNAARGVSGGNCRNVQVSNNRLINIGLRPEWANRGGVYDAMGVYIGNGASCRITNNVINNTGYASIWFSGSNHLIQNNYCYSCTMKLNDAGCIYTAQTTSTGSKILNNIIDQSLGFLGTTSGAIYPGGRGIMLDIQAQNTLIQGNTISGTTAPAIFINGGKGNQIWDNWVYDGYGPTLININEWAAGSTAGTSVLRNVFYSGKTYPPQYAPKPGFGRFILLETSKTATSPRVIASYDYNTFWAPYNAIAFSNKMQTARDFSLATWKTFLAARDTHSTAGPYQSAGQSANTEKGVWVNTNFDVGNVQGWTKYPSTVGLSVTTKQAMWPAGAQSVCVNRCLVATSPAGCVTSKASQIGFNAVGAIIKGKQAWRVQFKYATTSVVSASSPLKLTFAFRHLIGSATASIKSVPFGWLYPLDRNANTVYVILSTDEPLTPPSGTTGLHIDIRFLCANLVIDDIRVAEIDQSVTTAVPEEGVLFSNPTTAVVTRNFPSNLQYQDVRTPTKYYCGKYTLRPFTSVILSRPRNLGKPCVAFIN